MGLAFVEFLMLNLVVVIQEKLTGESLRSCVFLYAF